MLTISFSLCPLCDAAVDSAEEFKVANASSHPSYKPELPAMMRWLRCRSCSHVFTESYRSEEGDRVLFSSTLPHQLPNATQSEYLRNLWAPTVHRVAERLSETRDRATVFGVQGVNQPRWADIGFGNGGLIMTAGEFGFAATGVDARAEPVERLKALGYAAICSAFENLAIEEPLSVLSMADVLEHMPAPRAAIDKVHALLEADGLFYLSCPNSETSTWRLWEEANTNPYWGELEHYHNFSRSKLLQLLNDHGFRVIDYFVSARYYSCMEIIARKCGA
jgi:SAM-dependent methyltransferase